MLNSVDVSVFLSARQILILMPNWDEIIFEEAFFFVDYFTRKFFNFDAISHFVNL